MTLHALGAGLRQLHEVPTADCPFDWSVTHRLQGVSGDHSGVGSPPPVDRAVLYQGDPCSPNTLLAKDGTFSAHVDLARLGVADRWADLAVMSISLEWNYPDYDEAVFWDAYGVQPDPKQIAYYRKL